MIKKMLIAVLFACISFAPFAGACDSSYPNGVTSGNGVLTVNIADCTADNFTAKDLPGACAEAKTYIMSELNRLAPAGKSFTYIDPKNDANFIIYMTTHVVTPGGATANDIDVVSFKTFGLGLTADGHTLFTIVSTEGIFTEAIDNAIGQFSNFVNNGWVCNQ